MKQGKVSVYALLATVIIFCAVALRVILAAIGWPATNADEGTMGIMALHIAYHGELPLLFYGQNYMGVLEAYLGAGFFRLLGPSVFSLRLGVILLTTLFFSCMYLLTSLLYSKSLAIVTLLLLCFGSIQVFSREMLATGGSTQTLLFGALAFLGAIWLAKTYHRAFFWKVQRWRLLGYFGWGMVVGLGIWSDMVVLPFFALAALLLCAFCWRDLLRWAWLPVLLGLVVGAFPLILYNIQNISHSKDSFSTLLGLFQGTQTHAPRTLPEILYGFWSTLVISVPTATGNPFCPVQELPWLSDNTIQTVPCVIGHAVWGFGYLALLLWSMCLTSIPLVRRFRHFKTMITGDKSPPTDAVNVVPTTVLQVFARLALLGSGLLAIVVYALSSAPMGWPGFHARYLVGLLMVTPAVVGPLWAFVVPRLAFICKHTGRPQGDAPTTNERSRINASHYRRGRPQGDAPTMRRFTIASITSLRAFSSCVISLLPFTILLSIIGVLIIGTGMLVNELPTARMANQREADLIQRLKSLDITHVYTDYWSCDELAFVSNEQVICGVIDGNLNFSHNRDPRYAQNVGADAHSSYLLPLGAGQLAAVERLVAFYPGVYRRSVFDGYILYQPL